MVMGPRPAFIISKIVGVLVLVLFVLGEEE